MPIRGILDEAAWDGIKFLGSKLLQGGGKEVLLKGGEALIRKTLTEFRGEVTDMIDVLPDTGDYFDQEYLDNNGRTRPSRQDGEKARDQILLWLKKARKGEAPMSENLAMDLLGKMWEAIHNDPLKPEGHENNENNRRRMLRKLYYYAQETEEGFWDRLELVHNDSIQQGVERIVRKISAANEQARSLGQRIADATNRRRAT